MKIDESKGTAQAATRIPVSQAVELERIAAAHDRSIAAELRIAIANHIKRFRKATA